MAPFSANCPADSEQKPAHKPRLNLKWAMNSLHQQAFEASGVPRDDAFRADSSGLYAKLGGLEAFRRLSTSFYNRVFADTDTQFRAIFANIAKSEAIRNQSEYLSERFGGPPLYSNRKGPHMLIGRHGPYQVTEETATRWLYHMERAVAEQTDVDLDTRRILMDFFRHFAYYIAYGRELVNTERLVGYGGKHYGGA